MDGEFAVLSSDGNSSALTSRGMEAEFPILRLLMELMPVKAVIVMIDNRQNRRNVLLVSSNSCTSATVTVQGEIIS